MRGLLETHQFSLCVAISINMRGRLWSRLSNDDGNAKDNACILKNEFIFYILLENLAIILMCSLHVDRYGFLDVCKELYVPMGSAD